jgi:type I restriction enzyme, S subunit
VSAAVKTTRLPLAKVLANGLFLDGDWVESKDQDPAGDVRLIQLADVGDGSYVDRSARFLTSQKARELKCTFLEPGDILIARMPDPIGRACVFPGDERRCVTVVDVCIVRPSRDVDRRWLVHAINSPTSRRQINRHIKGATRERISRTNLGTIELDVPSVVTEQRRVADILDKADAIRRKRKEAIALTADLLRSVFLEMFGDPVNNPKGWPVKPLGQLLAFLTSGSRGWAEHYSVAGDVFLRIQNVKQDRLDLSDVAFVRAPDSAEARRTQTYPGDVLLSITADLGRTAVVPESLERAFINQHLAILRPRGVNPEYLSSFLTSEGGQQQVRRLNKGGVKAGLNFDDVRSVGVLLPPDDLQRAFADAKAQIRRLENRYAATGHQGNELFQSLMARAFSGELGRAERVC